MSENSIHPLLNAVADEMLARLELVALKPKRILAMDCPGLQARYPHAEIVATIDAENSIDLIVSNLYLPWCADVENLFRQWKRLLRPEGLLMFSSYGPNTLSEIANQPQFMDMHNVGDALMQSGFSDPVMDAEHFEVKYQDKDEVLRDLASMGIQECQSATLSLSFEIVYGHAWCPEKTDDFLADAEGVVNIPLAALRARLRK